MDWFTGSKQGDAGKLISQLADPSKRDLAAQALIKMGMDAVPALLDALQTRDPNLILMYQHLLIRIPSAKPELIKSLSTAQPLVRARIAETFGISRDGSVIPALLGALQDGHSMVRAQAVLALSNIGDGKVIPALLPLLKDREDEVRIAACTGIGRFRDPATYDEIANVLFDDLKIDVRRAAVRTLGESKHPSVLPFLMEALRDSFWWYEREQNVIDLLQAIQNMGVIAVDPLIEALSDREGRVRKFAAMLLGELQDVRAMEPLGMTIYDLHHEIGREAAESLALFGPRAIDILVEVLGHPEGMVRGHAVSALGKIQDVRVAPALIKMLTDGDRQVQKLAIQSLGGLHDERAIAALKEIAADRTDREMSMLAKQIIDSKKQG
jgi:HEAT repeat protein